MLLTVRKIPTVAATAMAIWQITPAFSHVTPAPIIFSTRSTCPDGDNGFEDLGVSSQWLARRRGSLGPSESPTLFSPVVGSGVTGGLSGSSGLFESDMDI